VGHRRSALSPFFVKPSVMVSGIVRNDHPTSCYVYPGLQKLQIALKRRRLRRGVPLKLASSWTQFGLLQLGVEKRPVRHGKLVSPVGAGSICRGIRLAMSQTSTLTMVHSTMRIALGQWQIRTIDNRGILHALARFHGPRPLESGFSSRFQLAPKCKCQRFDS